MPVAAMKHLLVRPAVAAPLDPNFAPMVLAKRKTFGEKVGEHRAPKYLRAVASASGAWEGILGSVLKGSPIYLEWALPRADDGCARYKLPVFPEGHEDIDASIYLAGALIQEMIWQRSAKSLLLCGPAKICEALAKESLNLLWHEIQPHDQVYKQKVVDIFQRISKEVAGDVPLKVINDGEVTALAAVQKLEGKGNIMGISMGSSEGAGYANAEGG
eukprot:Skav217884  [mRNA]  locus=scaffold67:96443:102716:+ [translate_table: standard]